MSLENGYRPREVYAPFDKSGTPPAGLPEQENPQQISSEDSFLPSQIPSDDPIENPSFGVENEASENNQDEISAIGQVAQSLAAPTKFREREVQEIKGTLDLTSEQVRQTILATRRALWEQTGQIEPLTGGSPKRREISKETPQPTEFVDRETARRRIEDFFNTHWNKKTKEGKKQYRAVLKEIVLLRRLYPDLYDDISKP